MTQTTGSTTTSLSSSGSSTFLPLLVRSPASFPFRTRTTKTHAPQLSWTGSTRSSLPWQCVVPLSLPDRATGAPAAIRPTTPATGLTFHPLRLTSSRLVLRHFPLADAVTGKEVGVGFSSGGFSRHFPMPSYQSEGVGKFLAGCQVPRSNFNARGRGFPDVAAVGVAFQIVVNGKVEHVGGTSAASPTFGAILSLVNSHRLSHGKKTIGWANPLLHAAAAASSTSYHDITEGNNGYGQCAGFNATVGWDPMTGWGTPNFPELVRQLIDVR